MVETSLFLTQKILFFLSPLFFSLLGLMFLFEEDFVKEKSNLHIMIVLGWAISFFLSATYSRRLLFLNAIFTCLLGGYGFSEGMKKLDKRLNG